jgi:hypothetical protein
MNPIVPSRIRSSAWLLLGLATAVLPGCFNSSSRDAANLPGTGRAKFYIETVEWGRLVDVLDDNGVLVERDVLIRESLVGGNGSYTIGLNPLTQSQTLTIHEDAGTAAFQNLYTAAQAGRAAIATKGLSDLKPFSMVGRNGAIRIQFSEYVDPALVNAETIKVQVGDPPVVNQNVRYLVDNTTVGLDGKPKGVVIIDSTVSSFDEANLGIPQNGVGFPASLDSINPNAVIRIPTKVDYDNGQFQVLKNLSGTYTLQATDSDPTELSAGLDPVILRAFRTGNDNDLYNGFMQDRVRPTLITELAVLISEVTGSGMARTLTYAIESVNCRPIIPKVGDVFEIGQGLFAVTKVENAQDPNSYVVTGAVLEDPASIPVGNYASNPLQGRITTAYSSQDRDLQLCWIKFFPEPEYGLPARGIDPYSTISITFSEPVDPSTVKALETFVVSSYVVDPVEPTDPDDTYLQELFAARQFRATDLDETVAEYIDRQLGYTVAVQGGSVTGTSSGSGRVLVGPLGIAPDGRTYTIAPAAGFSDAHDEGNGLRFGIALRDGEDGILDLAGNRVAFNGFVAGNEGQEELVTPGSASPWPADRYFSLRFNSTDENGDSLLEYGGQYTFEPGVLRGRDLVRFSRTADPYNPFVAQRIQFSLGVMTPLTPTGAVLMTCWPYHILGLGLLAVSEFNLDVESLNWAPFGGNVLDDNFARYSVALAHAERFPDDFINPASGYPDYPNSGLRRNNDYDLSILGFPDINEEIVWDGNYQLTSTKVFTATSGNKYMPWGDFVKTYTWRDTDITALTNLDGPAYLGGKSGNGVPPDTVSTVKEFAAEQIPSIGMPLLARFRCYPKGNFFGANGFQVQIMVGSSALPAFRIFSAGGRDAGGNWHQVLPDDRGSGGMDPQGGYDTTTGAKTKSFGPELYWHQVDFVLRISRVYTHWFSFGGVPDFISDVTQEPAPEFQPPNTRVDVEVRGVEVLNCGSSGPSPLTDANVLDFYGNYDNPCMSDTTGWRSDIQTLLNDPAGREYEFFQFRFTFVSNIEQNLSPELDALGLAWSIQ